MNPIAQRRGRINMPPTCSTLACCRLLVLPMSPIFAVGLLVSGSSRAASLTSLFFLSLFALAFSGVLLVVQGRNLWHGLTYIESCRRPLPTDFQLDPRANFAGVFGHSAGRLLSQLLPIPRRAEGDGVHFVRREARRKVHRIHAARRD